MKRPGRPKHDPEKLRDWQRRSRKRLPSMSAKRAAQRDARDDVRRVVIGRHGGRCAAWGLPGVPHDHPHERIPDARIEVHELRRGQRRHSDYLDPDWCIPLCPAAHRFATSDGYPEPSRSLGIVAASWETDPWAVAERREEARTR